MPKNAADIAAKYQSRVAGAGADYAKGVQSPRRDQYTAFAAAESRMAAGTQKALAEHKAVKNAQKKGGTVRWQQAAQTKGAQNYSASATYAAQGYAAVADKVISAGEAARAAANAMPADTLDQRIARSAAAQRATSKHWNG